VLLTHFPSIGSGVAPLFSTGVVHYPKRGLASPFGRKAKKMLKWGWMWPIARKGGEYSAKAYLVGAQPELVKLVGMVEEI